MIVHLTIRAGDNDQERFAHRLSEIGETWDCEDDVKGGVEVKYDGQGCSECRVMTSNEAHSILYESTFFPYSRAFIIKHRSSSKCYSQIWCWWWRRWQGHTALSSHHFYLATAHSLFTCILILIQVGKTFLLFSIISQFIY